MRRRLITLSLLFGLVCVTACATPGGPPVFQTPNSQNELTYDGGIALSIKRGETLAGTNLGYSGKSPDGRAILTIGGEQAPKSTADSVNFTGSPGGGALVTLNTRVTSFDNNGVNLIGAVHITIKDPQIQPGDTSPNLVTAYGIPVSYNVNKNDSIPGSLIQYLGSTPDGAQFSNVGGFPYRSQFDSVVWNGHLRDKIALRLELRVISFSEDSATLVGTARISFEQ